jgi:hypothetical protein
MHCFYTSAFSTSYFPLAAMDGKTEQYVYNTFCVKLRKSATETLEMLREAFGEYSLSPTVVFEWHSCYMARRLSIEDDERSGQSSTSKMIEMLKKFENSSTKTIDKQSMSSQTLLGSVMEFVRRS